MPPPLEYSQVGTAFRAALSAVLGRSGQEYANTREQVSPDVRELRPAELSGLWRNADAGQGLAV